MESFSNVSFDFMSCWHVAVFLWLLSLLLCTCCYSNVAVHPFSVFVLVDISFVIIVDCFVCSYTLMDTLLNSIS